MQWSGELLISASSITMQASFSLLILPVILSCLALVTAQILSSKYKSLPGVIVNEAFSSKLKASSKLDCIRKCKAGVFCAASFKSGSGECWVARFGFANTGTAADAEWITFIPLVPQPPILFILDSILKTKNVGSKGESLPVTASGFGWNAVGPDASNSARFSEFSASTRMTVGMKSSDGSFIVRLAKTGVTLSVWLKTHTPNKMMPIMEGKTGTDQSLYLWFPSADMNHIVFRLCPVCGGKENLVYSTVDNTDRLNWRHIAATYSETTGAKVFLNGREWDIHTREDATKEVSIPDWINIGGDSYGYSHTFAGSMACIAMYESVLNADEINAVMNSCP